MPTTKSRRARVTACRRQPWPTATKEFLHNLRELPHTVKDACFRLGKEPESEREESQATFHNLFLHIHSVRVHLRTLSPTLTFGLGLMAAASFVITIITGVLLMVYYKPSTDLAYQSIKDIHFTVSTGRFIRNIHRWAAQLMVLMVLLHMARVFFTGQLQEAARIQLAGWTGAAGRHPGPELHRLPAALGPVGLLGDHHRLEHRQLAARTDRCARHHAVVDPGGFQKRLAAGRELRRARTP